MEEELKKSANERVLGIGEAKPSKSKKGKSKNKAESTSDGQEVLLSLPGGFQYKMPGKRQRVVLGSIVIGLNALLLLAVILYFYNPAFQDFIYNVGRDVWIRNVNLSTNKFV